MSPTDIFAPETAEQATQDVKLWTPEELQRRYRATYAEKWQIEEVLREMIRNPHACPICGHNEKVFWANAMAQEERLQRGVSAIEAAARAKGVDLPRISVPVGMGRHGQAVRPGPQAPFARRGEAGATPPSAAMPVNRNPVADGVAPAYSTGGLSSVGDMAAPAWTAPLAERRDLAPGTLEPWEQTRSEALRNGQTARKHFEAVVSAMATGRTVPEGVAKSYGLTPLNAGAAFDGILRRRREQQGLPGLSPRYSAPEAVRDDKASGGERAPFFTAPGKGREIRFPGEWYPAGDVPVSDLFAVAGMRQDQGYYGNAIAAEFDAMLWREPGPRAAGEQVLEKWALRAEQEGADVRDEDGTPLFDEIQDHGMQYGWDFEFEEEMFREQGPALFKALATLEGWRQYPTGWYGDYYGEFGVDGDMYRRIFTSYIAPMGLDPANLDLRELQELMERYLIAEDVQPMARDWPVQTDDSGTYRIYDTGDEGDETFLLVADGGMSWWGGSVEELAEAAKRHAETGSFREQRNLDEDRPYAGSWDRWEPRRDERGRYFIKGPFRVERLPIWTGAPGWKVVHGPTGLEMGRPWARKDDAQAFVDGIERLQFDRGIVDWDMDERERRRLAAVGKLEALFDEVQFATAHLTEREKYQAQLAAERRRNGHARAPEASAGLFGAAVHFSAPQAATRLAGGREEPRRLLLMPCGGMKHPSAEPMPALERYTGPMYQSLKASLASGAERPEIWILSAKYGLIAATTPIATYDERLTSEKAAAVIAAGVPGDLARQGPFAEVLIAGGGEYRRAMAGLVEQMREQGILAPDARVSQVTGGIGEQRKHLNQWLRARPAYSATPEPLQEILADGDIRNNTALGADIAGLAAEAGDVFDRYGLECSVMNGGCLATAEALARWAGSTAETRLVAVGRVPEVLDHAALELRLPGVPVPVYLDGDGAAFAPELIRKMEQVEQVAPSRLVPATTADFSAQDIYAYEETGVGHALDLLLEQRLGPADARLAEIGDQASYSLGTATDTAAFQDWFSDSTVRDAQARPLVMYHGTFQDVPGFAEDARSLDMDGGTIGFHFGDHEAAEERLRMLSEFDEAIGRTSSGAPNVVPVYLAISSPLEMDDMASRPHTNADDGMRHWENPEDVGLTLYEDGVFDIDEFEDTRGRFDLIKARLKEKGFDGIVYRNAVEGAADSYIAFDPGQIKSVFNGGEWNREDSRISYSAPGIERDALREAELILRNETFGHHHGQTDGAVIAWSRHGDGDKIGYLDWTLFEGDVFIKMISVEEPYRRQGVATAMYRKLQDEFPGARIDWGGLTEDGAALKDAVAPADAANSAYFAPSYSLGRIDGGGRPLAGLVPALDAALDRHPQDRATGDHWAGIVESLEGVRREEIDWSGVLPWLESQEPGTILAKDEVRAFVRAASPRLERMVLVNSPDEAEAPRWSDGHSIMPEDSEIEERAKEVEAEIWADLEASGTWQAPWLASGESVEGIDLDDYEDGLQDEDLKEAVTEAARTIGESYAWDDAGYEYKDYAHGYVAVADNDGEWIGLTDPDGVWLNDFEGPGAWRDMVAFTEEHAARRYGERATKYDDISRFADADRYYEVLLTLPTATETYQAAAAGFQDKYGDDWAKRLTPEERSAWNAVTWAHQAPGRGEETYTGGHWDDPGVVVHLRVSEADTPANMNRWETNDGRFLPRTERGANPLAGGTVLVVEEVQSDWHKAGRARGYGGGTQAQVLSAKAKLRRYGRELQEQHGITAHLSEGGSVFVYHADAKGEIPADLERLDFPPETLALLRRHKAAHEAVRALEEGKGVADMPFKKSWPQLAMKAALRIAAEGGYDGVAWNTGEGAAKTQGGIERKGYEDLYDKQITRFMEKYAARLGARVGKAHLAWPGSYPALSWYGRRDWTPEDVARAEREAERAWSGMGSVYRALRTEMEARLADRPDQPEDAFVGAVMEVANRHANNAEIRRALQNRFQGGFTVDYVDDRSAEALPVVAIDDALRARLMAPDAQPLFSVGDSAQPSTAVPWERLAAKTMATAAEQADNLSWQYQWPLVQGGGTPAPARWVARERETGREMVLEREAPFSGGWWAIDGQTGETVYPAPFRSLVRARDAAALVLRHGSTPAFSIGVDEMAETDTRAQAASDDVWSRRDLARAGVKLPKDVVALANDPDIEVREWVAGRRDAGAINLRRLAADSDVLVRIAAAKNPHLPKNCIHGLAADASDTVRALIARRAKLPPEILKALVEDRSKLVRSWAALNPSLPEKLADRLSRDHEPDVRRYLASRPDLPEEITDRLARHSHADTRAAVAASPSELSTETVADLARDARHAVRRNLGRQTRPLTPIAPLFDPDIGVEWVEEMPRPSLFERHPALKPSLLYLAAGIGGSALATAGFMHWLDQLKPAYSIGGPEHPNADRLVIATGVRLRTKSGRVTAPAPRIDGSTDRKLKGSIARMNAWLHREAKREVSGDSWRSALVDAIDPARMSQSDQDTVNAILFDDPEGPTRRNVVGRNVSQGRLFSVGRLGRPTSITARGEYPMATNTNPLTIDPSDLQIPDLRVFAAGDEGNPVSPSDLKPEVRAKLEAETRLYGDWSQAERRDVAFMAAQGHPHADEYRRLRAWFDGLKYASNASARFHSYIDERNHSEYWAPELWIDWNAQGLGGFHGQIYPAMGERYDAYLSALADAGWPESHSPDLRPGSMTIATSDPAMREALDQAGYGSAARQHNGNTHYQIFPDSPEALDELRAIVDAHQLPQGALPPRTAADDHLAMAERPMADKSVTFANVDEIEVTPARVLVPMIAANDSAANMEKIRTASDSLLELVAQGLPPEQARVYLQHTVKPDVLDDHLARATAAYGLEGPRYSVGQDPREPAAPEHLSQDVPPMPAPPSRSLADYAEDAIIALAPAAAFAGAAFSNPLFSIGAEGRDTDTQDRRFTLLTVTPKPGAVIDPSDVGIAGNFYIEGDESKYATAQDAERAFHRYAATKNPERFTVERTDGLGVADLPPATRMLLSMEDGYMGRYLKVRALKDMDGDRFPVRAGETRRFHFGTRDPENVPADVQHIRQGRGFNWGGAIVPPEYIEVLYDGADHLQTLDVEINGKPVPVQDVTAGKWEGAPQVSGDLNLTYRSLDLPKALKVDGNLTLKYADIAKIGRGVKVGGNLNLYQSAVERLPKGMRVGGDVVAPDGRRIRGQVAMGGGKIADMPSVGGQQFSVGKPERRRTLFLHLGNRGNPDKDQDHTAPLPGRPNDFRLRVRGLGNASEEARRYIAEHDLGGGNWTGGDVTDDDGNLVAHVSYNGRVWEPGPFPQAEITAEHPLWGPQDLAQLDIEGRKAVIERTFVRPEQGDAGTWRVAVEGAISHAASVKGPENAVRVATMMAREANGALHRAPVTINTEKPWFEAYIPTGRWNGFVIPAVERHEIEAFMASPEFREEGFLLQGEEPKDGAYAGAVWSFDGDDLVIQQIDDANDILTFAERLDQGERMAISPQGIATADGTKPLYTLYIGWTFDRLNESEQDRALTDFEAVRNEISDAAARDVLTSAGMNLDAWDRDVATARAVAAAGGRPRGLKFLDGPENTGAAVAAGDFVYVTVQAPYGSEIGQPERVGVHVLDRIDGAIVGQLADELQDPKHRIKLGEVISFAPAAVQERIPAAEMDQLLAEDDDKRFSAGLHPIAFEEGLANFFGPLEGDALDRVRAAVADPNQETWPAAARVTVTKTGMGGITLLQALQAVNPHYPKQVALDGSGPVPSQMDLYRALRHAGQLNRAYDAAGHAFNAEAPRFSAGQPRGYVVLAEVAADTDLAHLATLAGVQPDSADFLIDRRGLPFRDADWSFSDKASADRAFDVLKGRPEVLRTRLNAFDGSDTMTLQSVEHPDAPQFSIGRAHEAAHGHDASPSTASASFDQWRRNMINGLPHEIIQPALTAVGTVAGAGAIAREVLQSGLPLYSTGDAPTEVSAVGPEQRPTDKSGIFDGLMTLDDALFAAGVTAGATGAYAALTQVPSMIFSTGGNALPDHRFPPEGTAAGKFLRDLEARMRAGGAHVWLVYQPTDEPQAEDDEILMIHEETGKALAHGFQMDSLTASSISVTRDHGDSIDHSDLYAFNQIDELIDHALPRVKQEIDAMADTPQYAVSAGAERQPEPEKATMTEGGALKVFALDPDGRQDGVRLLRDLGNAGLAAVGPANRQALALIGGVIRDKGEIPRLVATRAALSEGLSVWSVEMQKRGLPTQEGAHEPAQYSAGEVAGSGRAPANTIWVAMDGDHDLTGRGHALADRHRATLARVVHPYRSLVLAFDQAPGPRVMFDLQREPDVLGMKPAADVHEEVPGDIRMLGGEPVETAYTEPARQFSTGEEKLADTSNVEPIWTAADRIAGRRDIEIARERHALDADDRLLPAGKEAGPFLRELENALQTAGAPVHLEIKEADGSLRTETGVLVIHSASGIALADYFEMHDQSSIRLVKEAEGSPRYLDPKSFDELNVKDLVAESADAFSAQVFGLREADMLYAVGAAPAPDMLYSAGIQPDDIFRLTRDVDRYDAFVAPEGSHVKVIEASPDMVRTRAIEQIERAGEWNNEIHWYGDERADLDAIGDFMADAVPSHPMRDISAGVVDLKATYGNDEPIPAADLADWIRDNVIEPARQAMVTESDPGARMIAQAYVDAYDNDRLPEGPDLVDYFNDDMVPAANVILREIGDPQPPVERKYSTGKETGQIEVEDKAPQLSEDKAFRVPEGQREAASKLLKSLGVRDLREIHAATKAQIVKVRGVRESKGDFPSLQVVTDELERGLSVVAVEAKKWKVDLAQDSAAADKTATEHPVEPIAAAISGHDPSGQTAAELSAWIDGHVIEPARSILDAEPHEPAQVFLRELVTARDSDDWPKGKDLQAFFSDTIVPLAAAAVADIPAAKAAHKAARQDAAEHAPQASQAPQAPQGAIEPAAGVDRAKEENVPQNASGAGEKAISDKDLLARYEKTRARLKNTPMRPDKATVEARQALRSALKSDAALITGRGLALPKSPASKTRQAGQGRG